MLNALYPEIDWRHVENVGFDLDGTLYDEFEFIHQAYSAIIKDNVHLLNTPSTACHWMQNRWLEKGSSYPQIFNETFGHFGKNKQETDKFLMRALKIFREFEPQLCLSVRARQLLQMLKNNYHLFLVSDGNPTLQQRKFEALGLTPYFAPDDRIFTGAFASDKHKPSTYCLSKLTLSGTQEQTIFFGDRECDKQFAKAAGMTYMNVYNMIPKK